MGDNSVDLRPWTDVGCVRSGVIVSFCHDRTQQPGGAVEIDIDVPQDPPNKEHPGSNIERTVASFSLQIVRDDREMKQRLPLDLGQLQQESVDKVVAKIVDLAFSGIESIEDLRQSLKNTNVALKDVLGEDVSAVTTPSEPEEFEFACGRYESGKPFKLLLTRNNRAFHVMVKDSEGQSVFSFTGWLSEDFSQPDVFQYKLSGAVQVVTHHQD